MSEHGVVVVFDTVAPDHSAATQAVAKTLLATHPTLFAKGSAVVSWWFPEGPDKAVDRNDNDDMTLVNRQYIQALIDAYDDGDAEALEAVVKQFTRQLTGWAL